MPTWEYKIITSGSLGFASPQLLEQHLNQLGKEEWEIIHFQTRPDNPLAFSGLARRPVMRDWVVEPPAAASPSLRSSAVPAPPEESVAAAPTADELQAEAAERRESLLAREESLRPVRDGSSDEDEGSEAEESDLFAAEEELPTFFEAIRPHMRRNQRGLGMAVGVEYLAKKFGQTEADLIEALKECGFAIPASPKDAPVYLEFDGDLFWLNLNSRRQLWINTREKPRAAFRVVAAKKVSESEAPEGGGQAPAGGEPPPESGSRNQHRDHRPAGEGAGTAEPLPAGPELLDRLRPMMRRNRRDPGLSGSVSYLARALKAEPSALEAAFAGLGLAVPSGGADQPAVVAVGDVDYWLNRDRNGQIWINARNREPGPKPETEAPVADQPAESAAVPAPASEPESARAKDERAAPATASPLAAVRLLLKTTARGGLAAEVGTLAGQLHRSTEEMEATLVAAGLKVPAKPREKPVFVEHAGEIFWFNRNARGELWLNAKASKFAAPAAGARQSPEASAREEGAGTHRPRRARTKGDAAPDENPASPAST